MDRYKVIDRSVSCHCCFNFTVVDTEDKTGVFTMTQIDTTTGPKSVVGVPFSGSVVCETFEEEQAELVCKALNFYDSAKGAQPHV